MYKGEDNDNIKLLVHGKERKRKRVGLKTLDMLTEKLIFGVSCTSILVQMF